MKTYGLIGKPLSHSFSGKYFNEKFQREGIDDSRFELFPLDNIEDLPTLLHQRPDICGLAVTIPYKESVIPHLHSLSPVAEAIGAVNCIRVSADMLTGYNTDTTGFERSLLPGFNKIHKKALVLGSGGSSKAVQYALKKLNIDFRVISRGGRGMITYDSLEPSLVADHSLVINCTPLGMYPGMDLPALPYESVGPRHLLYDLVYNPPLTPFLSAGLKQGAAIKNGYEMLMLQAEENWKIWRETGC